MMFARNIRNLRIPGTPGIFHAHVVLYCRFGQTFALHAIRIKVCAPKSECLKLCRLRLYIGGCGNGYAADSALFTGVR